jgi:hypothetical protein
LTGHPHHLKVEVFKEDESWLGLPVGAPGYMSGDSLPELFADVEFTKHFCADVPRHVPLSVEYVAGQPEIADELTTIHAAYLALPPHLRPVAVAWDHDNDRPMNPVHSGPFTNPDQLRRLQELHAAF